MAKNGGDKLELYSLMDYVPEEEVLDRLKTEICDQVSGVIHPDAMSAVSKKAKEGPLWKITIERVTDPSKVFG